MRAWERVRRPGSFGRPKELVALPWESVSIMRMRCSAAASEAPRLTAVVVLPTPPFWLAIAMILPKEFSKAREGIYHTVLHMQLVSRETVFLARRFGLIFVNIGKTGAVEREMMFHVKRLVGLTRSLPELFQLKPMKPTIGAFSRRCFT